MKNFLISIGVGVAYLLIGFVIGLSIWSILTTDSLEFGMWGWLAVLAIMLLVFTGLGKTSTIVNIRPGQECEVRFRSAFVAIIRTQGKLLLPPGFKGFTARVNWQQIDHTAPTKDKGGKQFETVLTVEFRVTNLRKAYEIIDPDTETPVTLLERGLKLVDAAYQGYAMEHRIIALDLDAKNPEDRITISEQLLKEGATTDQIIERIENTRNIIETDPSGRSIMFYDCIEVSRITYSRVNLPVKLVAEILNQSTETLKTLSLEKQFERTLYWTERFNKAGVNANLSFGAQIGEHSEQQGNPVSHQTFETTGSDSLVAALIKKLTG